MEHLDIPNLFMFMYRENHKIVQGSLTQAPPRAIITTT